MTQDLQAELGHLATSAGRLASRRLVQNLVQSIARIDQQRTQGAVLSTLLEEARRFASRTAFFLTREEGIRCWSSDGFGAAKRSLEGAQLGYDDDAVWQELAAGSGVIDLDAEVCQRFAGRVDAPAATRGVLIPFMVHGQLGGTLYADQLDEDQPFSIEVLQILTHLSSQALETLAVRGAGVSPTLRWQERGEGEKADTPIWRQTAEDQPLAPESVTAPADPEDETDVEEAADGVGSALGAAVGAAVGAVAGAVAGLTGLERQDAPVDTSDERQAEEAPSTRDESAVADVEVDTDETAAGNDAGAPAKTATELDAAVPEVAASDLSVSESLEPASDLPGGGDAELSAVEFNVPDVSVPSEHESPAQAEPVPPSVEVQDLAADEEPASVGPSFELDDAEDEGLLDAAAFETADAGSVPPSPIEDTSPAAAADDEQLDDTASSLWDLEEEDEDATLTGPPPPKPEAADPPPAPLAASEMPSAPAVDLPDDAIGQQTVRLDMSALQSGSETPVAAPAESLGGSDEVTEDRSEDPTLMVSRAEILPSAPPPASEISAPPPAVEPPPARQEPSKPAGTSEVRPPDDVQGPGSAFSGSVGRVPEGEEALHEEARRLARLLVSEIKLYNEEVIEAGRRDGNIYDRLKDDIDRSRQMYEDRIDERIRRTEDYFQHELVQRLAGGNSALLGM